MVHTLTPHEMDFALSKADTTDAIPPDTRPALASLIKTLRQIDSEEKRIRERELALRRTEKQLNQATAEYLQVREKASRSQSVCSRHKKTSSRTGIEATPSDPRGRQNAKTVVRSRRRTQSEGPEEHLLFDKYAFFSERPLKMKALQRPPQAGETTFQGSTHIDEELQSKSLTRGELYRVCGGTQPSDYRVNFRGGAAASSKDWSIQGGAPEEHYVRKLKLVEKLGDAWPRVGPSEFDAPYPHNYAFPANGAKKDERGRWPTVAPHVFVKEHTHMPEVVANWKVLKPLGQKKEVKPR